MVFALVAIAEVHGVSVDHLRNKELFRVPIFVVDLGKLFEGLHPL